MLVGALVGGRGGVRRALDSALCHLTGLRRVQGEGATQSIGMGWSGEGGRVCWVGPPETLRSSLVKAAADGLGLPSGLGLLRASLPSHHSDPSRPGGTAAQGPWGLLVLPVHDSPDPVALPAAPPWTYPLWPLLLPSHHPPTHLPASGRQEMIPGLPAGLTSCTPLPWFPGPGPSCLEGTGFWPQGSGISSFAAFPSSRDGGSRMGAPSLPGRKSLPALLP